MAVVLEPTLVENQSLSKRQKWKEIIKAAVTAAFYSKSEPLWSFLEPDYARFNAFDVLTAFSKLLPAYIMISENQEQQNILY